MGWRLGGRALAQVLIFSCLTPANEISSHSFNLSIGESTIFYVLIQVFAM
jgi:hypothetical protein